MGKNTNLGIIFHISLVRVMSMKDGHKRKKQLIQKLMTKADSKEKYEMSMLTRGLMCIEKIVCEDTLALFTLLPEMIALEPKCDPEKELVPGSGMICDGYRWLLQSANQYYQISIEQFEEYLEEYKRRCLALGSTSLRSYYSIEGNYFQDIDRERAIQAFENYKKEPYEEMQGDCPACERRNQVRFYLWMDKKEKADECAKDLLDGTLACEGGENKYAIYGTYLSYYLRIKDYDKALEMCKVLESHNELDEYPADAIECYAHFDTNKGIKLYQKSWKKAEKMGTEKSPVYCKDLAKSYCVLWEALSKKQNTVSIKMPKQFPLYQKRRVYEVAELYKYYHKIYTSIQAKFDERNNSTQC